MKHVSGLWLLGLIGCAGGAERYPLADPMWVDPDRQVVAEPVEERYSGLVADGADQIFFRPVSEAFYLEPPQRAHNVNALDEVPNSSWFHNRVGVRSYTPEEAARAACGDAPPLDPVGPWTVTAAKPNGATPGFFIEAQDGRRYLLKMDGSQQPGRPTSADVIGSKLFWLAGYHSPCNQIVFFHPDILRIHPEAKSENAVGDKVPLSEHDLRRVLIKAMRQKDGRLRASASLFLPGRPVGPFTYEGTRGDDPNDVIPHEHRRELRGLRLVAAWFDRYDSREQNTLDIWVKAEQGGYVQHYLIDHGDGLGGRWPFDMLSRRLGRSGYFDLPHIFQDFVGLGFIPRPWNVVQLNPFDIFGYYDVEQWDPRTWRPGYPNPAFDNMDYGDALWAVRIIARIEPAHLEAIVAEGRWGDPRHEAFILQRMLERREKLLKIYLAKGPSLDRFTLARRTPGDPAQSLCFEDLALRFGALPQTANPYYKFRFVGGPELETDLGWLQFTPDPEHPGRSCVKFPVGLVRPSELAGPGAPDDDPLRYGVLQIFQHQRAEVRPTSETRIHLYDLGPERGFRLVGIQRPPVPQPPPGY